MEELIKIKKNGDQDAFTELIISMKNELYGVARTRLKSADDIDDAIQETMIIAFNRLNTLHENKFYKTWLVKILINECNHIYRKQRLREILGFENIEDYEDSLGKEVIDETISDMNFERLIEKLSYEEQLILKLFYKNNYTTREISFVLNRNENTIKTILRRAKEKIKQNYAGGDK